MRRKTHRTAFAAAALVLLGLLPAAAQPAAPPAGNTRVVGDDWPAGEVSRATYAPSAATIENAGVRVARAVKQEDLTGGPWATASVGDYLMENARVRLLVQGENRRKTAESPGTGGIADFVSRSTLWARFGGLTQLVAVDGQLHEVVYESVEIHEQPDAKSPPFLLALGALEGREAFKVFTLMRLEPTGSEAILETRCLNASNEAAVVEIIDRVIWGSLPVFIPGYGFPEVDEKITLQTQWLCGAGDDAAIGYASTGPEMLDVASLEEGVATVRVGGAQRAEALSFARAERMLSLRTDMGALSEFFCRAKNIPFGWLTGQVAQLSDQKPVANAELRVTAVLRGEKPGEAKFRPALMTQADAQGRYRLALPVGEYELSTRTPGRPIMPPRRASFRIREGEETERGNIQTDLNAYTLQALDADTGEAMPAKVRIEPAGGKAEHPDFGPPWKAQGAREVFYLKPGPNAVPLLGGEYDLTFSRGPEYEAVTRRVRFEFEKPRTVTAELKRVVPTPGMVSIDLNLATAASMNSRVSAEDLVLAAAGEGLEWIVSGDEGRATDLSGTIRSLGLEQWIKASRGASFSFRHPRLFGDFTVFPLPADASPQALAALADDATTPGGFFAAVRETFPDALVCVTKPLHANAGYLRYHGYDGKSAEARFPEDFSLDFDAVEVARGKNLIERRRNMDLYRAMEMRGTHKIPLASSNCGALYAEEPGYPRLYLVTGEDDAAAISDADLTKALRERAFFVTNGPIIDVEVDGAWPTGTLTARNGELTQNMQVTGAPWVSVRDVLTVRRAANRPAPFNLVVGRATPSPELLKYPRDEENKGPWSLLYRTTDSDTGKVNYFDSLFYVDVDGPPLEKVLTGRRGLGVRAFAFTPPVLVDADADGKIDFENP